MPPSGATDARSRSTSPFFTTGAASTWKSAWVQDVARGTAAAYNAGAVVSRASPSRSSKNTAKPSRRPAVPTTASASPNGVSRRGATLWSATRTRSSSPRSRAARRTCVETLARETGGLTTPRADVRRRVEVAHGVGLARPRAPRRVAAPQLRRLHGHGVQARAAPAWPSTGESSADVAACWLRRAMRTTTPSS